MKIAARVQSEPGRHDVELSTDGRAQRITVPPKDSGAGSKANGGELLFLALATCYCNDIYREAAKRGVTVRSLEVEVSGEFGGIGEPAGNVHYRAKVAADAPPEAIRDLMLHTDRVAEIQNTLRQGVPVTLEHLEVESVTAP
jgi:uncharacterized OsmC-like protein